MVCAYARGMESTTKTRPVERMDHDEKGLHDYLVNMTRVYQDFVFVGEDTDNIDDTEEIENS
jgi:hypothetical protein